MEKIWVNKAYSRSKRKMCASFEQAKAASNVPSAISGTEEVILELDGRSWIMSWNSPVTQWSPTELLHAL